MLEVFIEALLDSLKTFVFVFVFNLVISFFESKIAKIIEKEGRFVAVFGSVFGVIPQCGVSIVAADLYQKKHITMGTIIAVFIACSDEALPIVFSNLPKWYMGFALVFIKVLTGAIVGTIVDLIFSGKIHEVEEHHHHCKGEEEIHIGCCHHNIEETQENGIKEHLIHALIHSGKILGFIFVINMIFGTTIFLIGEDSISSFLSANKSLTPLLSLLVGMIPNCASSVILAEAYINSTIPFSALLCGLTVNAGLGMIVLFKNKENRKNSFIILGILSAVSLALGYAFLAI